jgi:hypothetical protein
VWQVHFLSLEIHACGGQEYLPPGIVSLAYNLIQLPGFPTIGANHHRGMNSGKAIHLPAFMFIPGWHHSRVANGYIGLQNLILKNVTPVSSHGLGKKSPLVLKTP